MAEIEVDTLNFAYTLSTDQAAVDLGNDESTLVSRIALSLTTCIHETASYQDGVTFASQTLGFKTEVSIDIKDTLVPSVLYYGLKSYDPMDERWIELIEQTSIERLPASDLVYFMSKSTLLSFSEILKVMQAVVFRVFNYKQPPSIYWLKTKQAIMLNALDEYGIVDQEFFYNERYR